MSCSIVDDEYGSPSVSNNWSGSNSVMSSRVLFPKGGFSVIGSRVVVIVVVTDLLGRFRTFGTEALLTGTGTGTDTDTETFVVTLETETFETDTDTILLLLLLLLFTVTFV